MSNEVSKVDIYTPVVTFEMLDNFINSICDSMVANGYLDPIIMKIIWDENKHRYIDED